MGRSLKSCIEIGEAELGRKLPGDFVDRMQLVTYDSFRTAPLKAVPGVKEAIVTLQQAGLDTCVASSGSVDKMKFTLGLTGLWDLFGGRVFSAAQVPRGKPFPDLFLHAALDLDVQPFECVVIEDSVPGVQAARSAGMRVFAYAGAPHADRRALSGAGGFLFDDMKELPGLVME
jgi:HAD superfamily hydrolase (TIGR01509 family)